MGRLLGCQKSQFENIFTGLSAAGTAGASRNKVGMWVDWWVVKTLSFFWFKHSIRNQKQSCYVGRLLGCLKSQFENVFFWFIAAVVTRNKVGTWVD